MITKVLAKEKPEVDLGGALRFNYNMSSWKPGQIDRGGDFGLDVFRINSKASYKGVKLNAEFRWYPAGFGGAMLKQGWVGYDFNEKNNMQLGLTQVPFGITQYNSHNWFFSLAYYVGLEDDHDMGIKYTHSGEKFDFSIAFFKNAEELKFGGNSDHSNSRYSYDIASIDSDDDGILDYRNKEVNQANAKASYKIGDFLKIGISGQFGGLYNLNTEKLGSHYAAAGHAELNLGNFDAKLQAANYGYDQKNKTDYNDDVIGMTAYGYPYLIASEATIYTAGVAYAFPVKVGPISSIQVYNDFGYMDKTNSDFESTIMNVAGFLVSAGNVYTYFDFAAGKDQPWLGNNWTNGLAQGNLDSEWRMRFNVNIGYYF